MKHPAIVEDWAGVRKAKQRGFVGANAASSTTPAVEGLSGHSSTVWGRRMQDDGDARAIDSSSGSASDATLLLPYPSMVTPIFPQVALGVVCAIALLAGLVRATAVLLSSRRAKKPPLAVSDQPQPQLKGVSSI